MVMRLPSKEKALANLTSKFVSDNDRPFLLLRGYIAGLSKANLIISVVFLAAVCVICVWLSWKKGSINPSLI